MSDPLHESEREQVRALAEDLRAELDAIKVRAALIGMPEPDAGSGEPASVPAVAPLPR